MKLDPQELDCRENINFSVDREFSAEREALYKEQRETRGFDDSETWDLDVTIARFILPRLKVFKDNMSSYPSDCTNVEEFKEIIDSICAAFEKVINIDDYFDDKEYKEGMALFAKYFPSLWW